MPPRGRSDKGEPKATDNVEKRSVDGVRRGSPEDRGKLARSQQAHIGSQLRAMYDDLVRAPIPDHLMELLNKVDQASSAERSKTATGDGEAGSDAEDGK